MTHQLQKLNYSHEALADQILSNPSATNAQLGEVFNRTKEWVGMVKGSGMFRELMALKRGTLIDPVVQERIEDRLEMVTSRSLEILAEKLARPFGDIPDDLALEAAKFGAKGMGLGGFSTKPPPVPELPMANRIENLAQRLINLNKAGATDAVIVSQPTEARAGAVSTHSG